MLAGDERGGTMPEAGGRGCLGLGHGSCFDWLRDACRQLDFATCHGRHVADIVGPGGSVMLGEEARTRWHDDQITG